MTVICRYVARSSSYLIFFEGRLPLLRVERRGEESWEVAGSGGGGGGAVLGSDIDSLAGGSITTFQGDVLQSSTVPIISHI